MNAAAWNNTNSALQSFRWISYYVHNSLQFISIIVRYGSWQKYRKYYTELFISLWNIFKIYNK
jgi:hypothetical protein